MHILSFLLKFEKLVKVMQFRFVAIFCEDGPHNAKFGNVILTLRCYVDQKISPLLYEESQCG